MKSAFFFLALFLLPGGRLLAQASPSQKPTPPTGPLIQKRAPAFSEWLITSTAGGGEQTATGTGADKAKSGSGKKEKAPSTKLLVTKMDHVIHAEVTDTLGHVWNAWNKDALHLVVSPDGKDIAHVNKPFDPTQVNPYYFDYSSSDFTGFEWVSEDNFEGVKPYKGKQCLVFRKEGAAGEQIAYTDQETRLPAALIDEQGVHAYDFRTPPPTAQALPPNVQHFLDGEQDHVKSVENRPTPPPGPLIQVRAPAFSEWLITSTAAVPVKAPTGSSADGGATTPKESKPSSTKVLVTKTDNIIHTAMTDSVGHVWNVWNRNSLHVVASPDGKDIGHANKPLDPTQVNPYYFDYSSSDFSGFEWISPDNFEGVKPYQGKQCLIFRKKSKTGELIACTDVENRLPVTLVDASGFHAYEFRAAPTAMQTLPDNVQTFLDAEQRHIKSLTNRPVNPY